MIFSISSGVAGVKKNELGLGFFINFLIDVKFATICLLTFGPISEKFC